MNEITIREVFKEDLDAVARIHKASFHDRALTQLGHAVVKRYYYWLLTAFPERYPLCAEAGTGEMAGFCFAGLYSGSFSGFLQVNKWQLAGALLMRPWLLANPLVREQAKLAINTLKNLLKYQRQNKHVSHVQSRGSAHRSASLGILSIAVDPAYQQRGVGELLMQAAEKLACENGYQQLHLSVHHDNIPAVSFYEKLGWEKLLYGDQWDGRMFKRLNC